MPTIRSCSEHLSSANRHRRYFSTLEIFAFLNVKPSPSLVRATPGKRALPLPVLYRATWLNGEQTSLAAMRAVWIVLLTKAQPAPRDARQSSCRMVYANAGECRGEPCSRESKQATS